MELPEAPCRGSADAGDGFPSAVRLVRLRRCLRCGVIGIFVLLVEGSRRHYVFLLLGLLLLLLLSSENLFVLCHALDLGPNIDDRCLLAVHDETSGPAGQYDFLRGIL